MEVKYLLDELQRRALSVAFAQTHVANRQEYQPYLEAAYAKAIAQAPLGLSLVQLLTATQLSQALDGEGNQGVPEQSAIYKEGCSRTLR